MQSCSLVGDDEIKSALSILEENGTVDRTVIQDLARIWTTYSCLRNVSPKCMKRAVTADEASRQRSGHRNHAIQDLAKDLHAAEGRPCRKQQSKHQHFTQDEVISIFRLRPNANLIHTGECMRRLCASQSKQVSISSINFSRPVSISRTNVSRPSARNTGTYAFTA
jgi:hypothetical protein